MNAIRGSSLFPYLVLGVGILSLGFSGIFVSWAGAPGAVASFYRMAVASLAMALPFARRRRSKSVKLTRRSALIAVLGGAVFSCDLFLFNTGVLMSGAVNPTLMSNTAPLWVGLGALIFFRETLNRRFWLGLAIAITGAVIVLGDDALQDFTVGLGTLLGLLAGIFYGGYYLVTQYGRRKLDSLSYSWLAALSSTTVLLFFSFILSQPLAGYPTRTYVSLIGLGLVVQVLGQLSFSYALGYLPASFVAPAGLGQPVMTALLAVPLLGEGLSLLQIVGGSAVLVGVYLVHRSRMYTSASKAGE
ncbi:MAG: DMT family transporter [Candidatus Promineifilaceae bacterium]|nr:DMT family transporter [Candidatus Promineifilaceae bacterium]